jgi:hypothetical protein
LYNPRIYTLLTTLSAIVTLCTLVRCGIDSREHTSVWYEQVEWLDGKLHENSGLILWNDRLWTINDSGGDPVLYAIEIQSGKVVQEVYIENGSNRDWESLAQDDQNIYVCDIGNNMGHRDELTVYRIDKNSIPPSGNASVKAGIIDYTYAGMEDINSMTGNWFDCEAVVAMNDSLYLFTKERGTGSTTLYTCSTHPGKYELHSRRTYPVDGMVTGADKSPDRNSLVLCGYKDYIPLIWIFQDFNPGDYSYSDFLRFDFPERKNTQTEGIAIPSPGMAYISSEATEFPAALYRLDLRALTK